MTVAGCMFQALWALCLQDVTVPKEVSLAGQWRPLTSQAPALDGESHKAWGEEGIFLKVQEDTRQQHGGNSDPLTHQAEAKGDRAVGCGGGGINS